MKLVDGWWVPDRMGGCGNYVSRSLELLEHMKRFKGRKVCVQAGGHIGTYPKLLAKHFGLVYTFEPECENFGCLARNCPEENVFAARGALGARHGGLTLRESTGKSTGKHQVSEARGPVPLYLIDDLALEHLDMLVLDVEGFEIEAMTGAWESLHKFRPLIVAEENARMGAFRHQAGDIERFLEPIGYRVVDRVGEDIVLSC